MSNAKQSETRTRISLDDFTPEEPPEVNKELLREVSSRAGFGARDNKAPEKSPSVPMRRARRATGRTYPFNTKLKPETYNLICNLSDEMSDEEDRPVSMAEVLERALAELVKTRESTKS